MDPIIAQLVRMNALYGAWFGGTIGSFFGMLIAAGNWARDEARIARQRWDRLMDRVDVLEGKTANINASGQVLSVARTSGETQVLSANNITGVVTNAAITFQNLTAYDVNRPGYHNIRITASGAVAVNTIGSVRWSSTPFAKAGAPDLTFVLGDNTSAGAAKLTGLIPVFDASSKCIGYDIDSPIALANGDVINLGVRCREPFSPLASLSSSPA